MWNLVQWLLKISFFIMHIFYVSVESIFSRACIRAETTLVWSQPLVHGTNVFFQVGLLSKAIAAGLTGIRPLLHMHCPDVLVKDVLRAGLVLALVAGKRLVNGVHRVHVVVLIMLPEDVLVEQGFGAGGERAGRLALAALEVGVARVSLLHVRFEVGLVGEEVSAALTVE